MLDKTQSIQVLRWLVIADAVFYGLTVPVAFIGEFLADGIAHERGIAAHDPTPTEISTVLVGCGLLSAAVPIMVVSWVGLLGLRPWSRWLYLGVSVIFVTIDVCHSFVDFSFQWGFVGQFESLSRAISGLVLTFTFFSPAAEPFGKQRESHRTQHY